MDLGLKDRTALVTGGSRGLGRQIALSLAREGCNVAVCARGKESLEQTVMEIQGFGVSALGIQADVTLQSGGDQIVEEIRRNFGHLDVLINNVGGSEGKEFDSADDAAWEHTFQLNLFAGIRLIRFCLPAMKKRGWGRIISVASIWGREFGGGLTYMTAKAALISFSKHLAIEVAGTGVTVNTIAPGSIVFPGGSWERFQANNTPDVVQEFIRNNLPMGRFGWPEPVGELTAFLASKHADLITGTCINIDGGQSRSIT